MEKVMAVPTPVIAPLLPADGFITENVDEIIRAINASYQFIDRAFAEYSTEYKQIIPYAVLMNGPKYFLTRRLKKQTEKRLHGMYSIGMGGHINPGEASADNIILAGMRRELREEVGLERVESGGCAGIINDLSTDVSSFHIGLVYPVYAPGDIAVAERGKMTGRWATEEEISAKISGLESWSQIVWEHRRECFGAL